MSEENRVRILLVDDHEIVRRGLRSLLEVRADWEICGEAADGRTAVKMARALAPQIVVMDLQMPELNGFEAARQMVEKVRGIKVLILSMHESEQLVREVLAAGAQGYVLKSAASRDLISAVEKLLRGEPSFVSPLAAGMHAKSSSLPRRRGAVVKGKLTPREREITQLLAEGKSNKQVGLGLGISVKTAETHRARIMRKLEIDSIADLVRYAIRNGLIGA